MAVYDWRGAPEWKNLTPRQKWAAMTLLETGNSKPDAAKNVAHAIYNRSKLEEVPIDKHIETRKGRGYGIYQPLYEPAQQKRMGQILRSQQFSEMLDYVDKIEKGEVEDTTKGATHYLVPPSVMLREERKNPRKYKNWGPRGINWTGYDESTGKYANETVTDGVHNFLVPKDSQARYKKKGIDWTQARAERDNVVPTPARNLEQLKATLAAGAAGSVTTIEPDQEEVPAPPTPAIQPDTEMPVQAVSPDSAMAPQVPEEAPQQPAVEFSEAETADVGMAVEVDTTPTLKARSRVQVYSPKSYEQARAEVEAIEAENGAGATSTFWDSNITYNTVEDVYNRFNPQYHYKDPNFNPDVSQIEGIEEGAGLDYVTDAGNADEFERRKFEVLSRQKANEEFNAQGWGAYLGWGAAHLAVDVLAGMALTPISGPAGSAAVGLTALKAGTKAYAVTRLGADALVGGGLEMYGAYKSGQMTSTEAMLWTAGAGVLGATAGRAFFNSFAPGDKLGMKLVQANEELAEDIAIEAAEKAGLPMPKIDTEAEIVSNGTVPREVLDDDASTIVVRDGTPEEIRKATEMFDGDLPKLESVINLPNLGAKGTAKAYREASEAFTRQAVRSTESVKAYAVVPASVDDLATVFKNKVLVATKSLDEATQNFTRRTRSAKGVATREGLAPEGFKIVEIDVPKGSRIVSDFPFKAASPDRIMIGEGTLKASDVKPSKVPKGKPDTGMQIQKATFVPDKPAKGTKVYAKAVTKSGRELSAKEQDALNRDLLDNGDNAAANTLGASGGSARVYQRGRLTNVPMKDQDVIEYADSPEGKLGYFSTGFWISRINMLQRSNNNLVRAIAPHLMSGALDMSPEAIKKGARRPVTTEDVKRNLTRPWETKLKKAEKDNFAQFAKDYKTANPDWRKSPETRTNYRLKEVFKKQIDEGMAIAYDTGNYPADMSPAAKKHAEFLDDFFFEFLDLAKNPGRAVGQPDNFEGLDGFKDTVWKRGWRPRSWNLGKIDEISKYVGPRALQSYLEENLNVALSKPRYSMVTGEDGVVRRVREPTKEVPDGLARRMAKAMNDSILTSRSGWNIIFNQAAKMEGDADELLKLFRAYKTGDVREFSEEEMDWIADFLYGATQKDKNGGAGTNSFHRTLLIENEKFMIRGPKGAMEVKLSDFVNTDVDMMARDYLHKMSGRIALGSTEIIDPVTGQPIVSGIRGDADWAKLMKKLEAAELNTGISKRMGPFSDKAILENHYQFLTHTYDKLTPASVQMIKNFAGARILGQAGFAQLGEISKQLEFTGIHTLLRLPAFGRVLKSIGPGMLKDGQLNGAITPLLRMVREDWIGSDLLRMEGADAFQDANTNFAPKKGIIEKGRSASEKYQNFVLKASGLAPLTQGMQGSLMQALHDQMLKWAVKYPPSKLPRRHRKMLANAGLTDVEIDAALKMFANEDIIVRNKLGGAVLEAYDIRKGSPDFDEELYFKVESAFTRMMQRGVQENARGAMPPGFDHPAIKIITQIRNFMIGSMQSQLVQSTRKGASAVKQLGSDLGNLNFSATDGATDSFLELMRVASGTLGQIGSGILAYMLMERFKMIGEPEDQQQAKWDDMLKPENLFNAGISRSGWLGSAAFIHDSSIGQFTGTKFNGYRSTGLTEDIFGNPVTGLVTQAKKVGASIGDFAEGSADSKDALALSQSVTNLWFANIGVNLFAQQFLEMPAAPFKPAPKTALGGIITFDE